MKSFRVRMQLLLVLLSAVGCATLEPVKPMSAAPSTLRVEYAENPLGIDVLRPRLAWQAPGRGDGRQTAYRIRVARSAQDFETAPLWDSGKVASTASTQIVYGGPELQSRQRCWWQVQVWDGQDQPSDWSAPASWEMGLLQPTDWSAQWVSADLRLQHEWRDSRITVDFSLTGKSVGFLFRARPVGKTYGEAYLWTLVRDDTTVRLVQQVRRYAGGNSSKVNVNTLRSLTLSGTAAEWVAQRHRLIIEARGDRILTTIDGQVLQDVQDLTQASGTIGFIAAEAAAAIIHGVQVEGGAEGDFRTDFADGINPFTGGSLVEAGLQVAAGVPDKDLVLPIASPAPLLRRAFQLAQVPASARLYVAAGGLPRLQINGAAIGEAIQDGYTDYGKRVLYRSFDVTGSLRLGENVIGAELGRGWYGVTEPNEWYWHMALWHGAPALRLQLEVTFADGTRQTVASGGDWRATAGPTQHDSVYGGERYDARLLPAGWQQAAFDDRGWKPVRIVQGPAGQLAAAQQQPIGVTGTIRPVEMHEPQPGVYVFDFGRIFAGRPVLRVSGPRGTTVRTVQTEKLNPDGTVAVVSGLVDTQLQTDQYTLAGEGLEEWKPRFGYRGFRYVQVEGYPGKPTLASLDGELMHSAVASNGRFESSSELLNQIQSAARNTLLNNMHGNQTDTPTLEKNGWTGDAQASSLASILNFDVARVWTKWLADFRDAQSSKGEIPEIVPSTPYYGYEDTPGWSAVWGPIPSWDAATFVLPWEMYRAFDDRRILAEMYDTQKKLVDYTGSYFSDKLSYRNPNNFLLGEYASVMPPGGIIAALRLMPNGPIDATATAYYYHMLDLLSQSAALLGKDADAVHYRALAERVREAYNLRYWDAAGQYYKMPGNNAVYAQSPNVFGVAFGLAPAGNEAAIMRRLNDDIVKRGYHLGAGVYAGRYLMSLLGDYGHAETAFKTVTQTAFPSWGFWIENGLSTMAEGWELSSRSWDHHYWASISSYFYQSLAGIRERKPGYVLATIKPQIPPGLEWVKASLRIQQGELASSWKVANGRLTMEVEVPGGVDAEIWVPVAGAQLPQAPATTTFLRHDGGYAVYRAGRGHHVFEARRP